MRAHFVFTGGYYFGDEVSLRPIFLKAMKKYEIKKVMVSIFYMRRRQLITKEKMENYCNGEDDWRKSSVNDDLESLFEVLILGKEPIRTRVETYFLPKLTKEEMDLVGINDSRY